MKTTQVETKPLSADTVFGTIAKIMPIVSTLRGYPRAWVRRDLLVGATVFAMVVPSSIAYAELAGVPPVAGLYAAVGAMIGYALFGSSRQMMVGPDAASALLVAASVAPLAAGDPSRYGALAALLGLMMGCIFILAGLIRLGFIADFLSRPILVGYMTGVALVTISTQLGKLFGIRIEGDRFFPIIWELLTKLGQTSILTLDAGLIVIAVLIAIRRFKPQVPGPLAVVIGATIISGLLNLAERGLVMVGPVPSGLPIPSIPNVSLDDVQALLGPGVGLVLIVFSDGILTARSFAAKNRYDIDANQELIALGAANFGAGLLQGFPISSSSSRTAVNDSMRGKTQIAQLLAAGLLVVFLIYFASLLQNLPVVVLASVIVVAAAGLIDIASIRRLYEIRRIELLLTIVTLLSVMTVGILRGILVAVSLAILDVIRRISRPHDAVLGPVKGVDGFHEIDQTVSSQAVPGLIVYRFDAHLFFANAPYFVTQIKELIRNSKSPTKYLLIDAEAIVDVDSTAHQRLRQLRQDLEQQGIGLGFARAKAHLREMFTRTGLAGEIGEQNLFPTVRAGVRAYLAQQRYRLESQESP